MAHLSRRQFMGGTAAAAAALGLAACGGNSASTDGGNGSASKDDAKKSAIVVFAAASMTESLTRAGDQFTAANDQYELSFNYDSSGTLKTQIQEGADCDVFISAGQKQMNQMDITAASDVNTEGLDLIDHDTRFDILENKVTLVVPEGNPKSIQSFGDLASHLQAGDILMVMGNSDVPVGQYTQKILDYYNLDEEALASAGTITYATNVKEVTGVRGLCRLRRHLPDRRLLRRPGRRRLRHKGHVRSRGLPGRRHQGRSQPRGRPRLPGLPQGRRGLRGLPGGRLYPAGQRLES